MTEKMFKRSTEQTEIVRNKILKPLEPYLKELSKKDEFVKYVDYIISKDVNLVGAHVGYIEDNILLSKLIPKSMIVVDVGCGFGFQHILYKNHRKYIGIQKFIEGNVNEDNIELNGFTKNSWFFQGWFRDVVEDEGLKAFIAENKKDLLFGVAHISLYSAGENINAKDIEIFNSLFKRKWIL